MVHLGLAAPSTMVHLDGLHRVPLTTVAMVVTTMTHLVVRVACALAAVMTTTTTLLVALLVGRGGARAAALVAALVAALAHRVAATAALRRLHQPDAMHATVTAVGVDATTRVALHLSAALLRCMGLAHTAVGRVAASGAASSCGVMSRVLNTRGTPLKTP